MKLATIILAAGQGKRMNNPNIPKVLAELNNKPLIEYVLETANKINAEKNVIVIGHKRELVKDFIKSTNYNNIYYAIQDQQLGTGHAVNQAKDFFIESDSNVLILCGDVPLISHHTLNDFIYKHINNKSDISVLSTYTDSPKGYGRIARDKNEVFTKIIEEKDATEDEKTIKEINSGIYLISSKILFNCLSKISNQNAQGEYYLTDIIAIAKKENYIVTAFPTYNFDELQGINTPQDLEKASVYLNSINKPFKILGVQQIAIGSANKEKTTKLWKEIFGFPKIGEFMSYSENVNEDILQIQMNDLKIELDIMEPLDKTKKPDVSQVPLNHIGLWVDDITACYNWFNDNGVRTTPGGIRKGASGYNIFFIHPKSNNEFPISGEGVLIEIVQAPDHVIKNITN